MITQKICARRVLFFCLFVCSFLAGTWLAAAEELEWEKSPTLTEKSRYGKEFKRFDYVNPNAKQGGTYTRGVLGTFDSFNPYIVKGKPAAGFTPIKIFGGSVDFYQELMMQSTQEPGVSHGLIAEAISYPDDYAWAKYRLNPKARWHDGQPITTQDVIWSFNILKEISPVYAKYYADVVKAKKTGEREVTFVFSVKGNRELPKILGDMIVLPQHWWEGADKNGNKRDIRKPTMEVPLGSGPYKIEKFEPGRSITWVKVPNHWAKDHPLYVGRANFERIRYIYFLNMTTWFEAFKKGILDYFFESRFEKWKRNYNFPAVVKGDVIKYTFPLPFAGGMKGFALNTRLEKFSNRNVRKALVWLFDADIVNRTLYFNEYERITSFFSKQYLAALPKPNKKEMEILKNLGHQIYPEVFSKEYKLPSYKNSRERRKNIRYALNLFQEAGFKIRDGVIINKKGEPFTIEFLIEEESSKKLISLYQSNLHRVGIQSTIRLVDSIQFYSRTTNFDFEVIMASIDQTISPGNEQRDMWGSEAADRPGSRNFPGIKNNAVDKLIKKIILAKDRKELLVYTNVLDRVLLWGYYYVPVLEKQQYNIALRKRIKVPPKEQPPYTGFDFMSFWIEEDNNP